MAEFNDYYKLWKKKKRIKTYDKVYIFPILIERRKVFPNRLRDFGDSQIYKIMTDYRKLLFAEWEIYCLNRGLLELRIVEDKYAIEELYTYLPFFRVMPLKEIIKKDVKELIALHISLKKEKYYYHSNLWKLIGGLIRDKVNKK